MQLLFLYYHVLLSAYILNKINYHIVKIFSGDKGVTGHLIIFNDSVKKIRTQIYIWTKVYITGDSPHFSSSRPK
jgi:hypothetical protein